MQLIDNWRKTHRKYSVQAMALSGSVVAGWESIPADLKAALPACAPHVVAGLVLALLALGIVGSMIDQGAVTAAPETPRDQ